jgi:pimeloyl-ACP methyl ester carboxylesterase
MHMPCPRSDQFDAAHQPHRTIRRVARFMAAGAILVVVLLGATARRDVPAAVAAGNGTLLGQVTFGQPCPSGIGVGVTFDGQNLWYSCYASSTDLYKASATTGQVLASYNVAGGLGALAWDQGRGKIWAGTGCGSGQTGAEIYLIDPATGTGSVQVHVPNFSGICLDDGLAYDRSNDSLYHSPDGATVIRHLSASTGLPLADDGFVWAGSGCYNSGLAIGGDLLYEGSNGCTHIWVVDKNTKAASFDFPSPGIRDEGLSCDGHTFPGKTAMWSKDAYNNTAYAFEIPLGSCNVGGVPLPPHVNRNIVFVQGIDSTGDCSGANSWIRNYLDSPEGRSWFNAISIGTYWSFNYNGGGYDCALSPPQPVYAQVDTCHGIALEASRLRNLIDTQSPTTKVTIFAHSMGGLIAAYLVGTHSDWATQHIASVMTFDSPLRGISDLYADNWNNALREWFAPSSCKSSTDLTSVEDMRHSSAVVLAAASAAHFVSFYSLDATNGSGIFVSRDTATLGGTWAFHLMDSCSQPGANRDTCEPPLPVQDDHGSVWNSRYDAGGVDKAFLAGCAAQAMFDCTFLRAPVSEGSVSEAKISVGPDDALVRFVSSFGSIIRMTLIASDGTVYGPDGAGDVAAYGVDDVSETYEIANPTPGTWTIRLDGIDVPQGTENVGIAFFVEALRRVPDTTPPVTTVSIDPAAPDGLKGWYISPVTVTLTATDPDLADGSPGSGVAVTRYRVDEGPWTDYTGPFVVNTDSPDHKVEWFSEDLAGNVEATHEIHFRIDQTRPIFKVPQVANLWLCSQPACPVTTNGVNHYTYGVGFNGRVTDLSPKGEPQTIGSFEYEVRFDAKLVDVQVEPGPLFSGRPAVSCATTPGQGFVQFRCVTKGKPADAPIGPGILANITVTPKPDVYSILIANQGNGIATQLINQDCGLSDLQGHPIQMGSCDNAALTIRYLEGDLNADCVVNVQDQQQIAFRWGSHTGNLLYNSRLDLEPAAPKQGDGDIDAKDLQVVFGRHGSTCADPHPAQPPIDPKATVVPPGA